MKSIPKLEMSSLAEITGIEPELLRKKFQLEPRDKHDNQEADNLVFVNPTILLKDLELRQGGWEERSAKDVLGLVTKDILTSEDPSLFQVPEITGLHMGYGKKSANKAKKMAITEKEAKFWYDHLRLSRFGLNSETAEGEERPGEEPMDIEFSTPEDTEAFETVDDEDMVDPSDSGLLIREKGSLLLFFSILLILDKSLKKKKSKDEEEQGEEDEQQQEEDQEELEEGEDRSKSRDTVGPNKVSDFILFWIIPYLLNFSHQKVMELTKHIQVNNGDPLSTTKASAMDIINNATSADSEITPALKERLEESYREYFGTKQLEAKYTLLASRDGSPIILVPIDYQVRKTMSPAYIKDLGKKTFWQTIGHCTLVDEFLSQFVKVRGIQKDFFDDMKDVHKRQAIDYGIILPDEKTCKQLKDILVRKCPDRVSMEECLPQGRGLISPYVGLVKYHDNNLIVGFSYLQGKGSERIAALFRAIGSHFLNHFTLAFVHGSACNPHDPDCRLGNLYPIDDAVKVCCKGRYLERESTNHFENCGNFAAISNPRSYQSWELEVCQDKAVKKLLNQGKIARPEFHRCNPVAVAFSQAHLKSRLTRSAFGPAMALTKPDMGDEEVQESNREKLAEYNARAVNLDGCALGSMVRCARKNNLAVIAAINDTLEPIGSGLAHLPEAVRGIVVYFVMAVITAGLPTVYEATPDEQNREDHEMRWESSEQEAAAGPSRSGATGASINCACSETGPESEQNMSIKVTLLGDEWGSSRGGLSTINRELAKQFAQHEDVQVSLLVPEGNCSDADRAEAGRHNVTIVEAKKRTGYVPREWLSNPPKDHSIDIVIGHDVVLGKQAPDIKEKCEFKWIQFVHTEPEQLAMHKKYPGAISKGEEKQNNLVELCEEADLVVAIGPKLTGSICSHLRHCKKDESVVNLTPGIFSDFATIEQAAKELEKFHVLVFGRGDPEDFELKGFDIAAEAFKELDIRRFHLTFVGATAGKQDEVVKHLQTYGISLNQLAVRSFCKSREELGKLFCNVDLAIMPSRTEGFGLTGLEALSAGLPVLVSANSGFAEALMAVPGGSSCIVQSSDQDSSDPGAKDWAKKVKEVRQKPRSVRLKEAKNLRAEYAEQFDWKQQCDALVEKMRDMVHDKAGTRDDEEL